MRPAEKIQNAGAVHADAEDGKDDGQDQREHEGRFHQQEDGQQERRSEDGNVPELPEEKGWVCGEVFGVDEHEDAPLSGVDWSNGAGIRNNRSQINQLFPSIPH